MHCRTDLNAVDRHGHWMYLTNERWLPPMRTHVWLLDYDDETRVEVIPFAIEPSRIEGRYIVYCWRID